MSLVEFSSEGRKQWRDNGQSDAEIQVVEERSIIFLTNRQECCGSGRGSDSLPTYSKHR